MNYTEQMQAIADRYTKETGATRYTVRELAAWAIQTRQWEPHPSLLIKQCAEDFAKALREHYITDGRGRRVRAKHVALVEKDDKQIPIWEDIRTASPGHMQRAFQLRRQQIVGDCRQFKTDVDSYNQFYNKGGEQLVIIFDFRDDLADEALAA